MQDRSQMLAVIGAGPVGLAIAKGLKAHGVAYEQLEADDDVGGNWYHGVYETAHIISSKKTTEYSDFPMSALTRKECRLRRRLKTHTATQQWTAHADSDL